MTLVNVTGRIARFVEFVELFGDVSDGTRIALVIYRETNKRKGENDHDTSKIFEESL